MLLAISAVVILLVLFIVWYMQPSASDKLLGQRVTITIPVIPPNVSLCSSQTVTAIGTVTRVNSDGSVGVTWDTLSANPPYPPSKPDSYKCAWRRSPADSDSHIVWNNTWFGNDTADPTGNYGLQSVYPKAQTGRLAIVV